MAATGILDEARAALAALGRVPHELAVLSPPEARKRGRATVRAELGARTRVKLRFFESAEAAERCATVRSGLPSSFAAVIDRAGRVLVEEWIEGQLVGASCEPARAREAGEVLARLHAGSLPAEAARDALDGVVARVRGDVAALVAAEALTPADGERLGDALDGHQPAPCAAVLLHRDFCGENMVVDGAGRLRVIDNEWFAAGPAGFDVGRSLARWPLTQAGRASFVAGYRSSAALTPDELRFWEVAAAVWSARLRLGTGARRLDPAVARVHALVSADGRIER